MHRSILFDHLTVAREQRCRRSQLLPPVMNRVMTDEDLNFIGSIAPVKLLSRREGRRRAKLLIGDFKFVGSPFQIVLQRSPRNGKVFLTEAKKTPEAQNC